MLPTPELSPESPTTPAMQKCGNCHRPTDGKLIELGPDFFVCRPCFNELGDAAKSEQYRSEFEEDSQ